MRDYDVVGRPRDATVETRAIAATVDLLIDVGFDRLSVEGVAELAGVSRPAIYRRWTTKTDLVVAAVAAVIDPPPAVPDSGSLRTDLLACARAFVQQGERGQMALSALIAGTARDQELRDVAFRELARPYQEAFATVVARAAGRHQVNPSVDLDLAASAFAAFAFQRTAAMGMPVDQEFAERVIDGLLLPALQIHPPSQL